MKYKVLFVTIFIALSWRGIAHAAIFPVALNQDSLTAQLSQDVTIDIVSHDYTGDRLFVEYTESGSDMSVKIFPSTVDAHFVLITDNAALVHANPEYQYANSLEEVAPEQPEGLAPVVIFGKKTTIYNGDKLVLTADSAATDIAISENLRNYSYNAYRQISKVFDIANPSSMLVAGDLRYTGQSDGRKFAAYFSKEDLQWHELPSYNDILEHYVTFNFDRSWGRIAVFEDQNTEDGLASWYDQSRYGTFDYQNGMFAAHRDFPKGSKVKVTRLKTGKSIIVTINDWGPEEWTGRSIDLDKAAFEAIASVGAGQVYVNIELLND